MLEELLEIVLITYNRSPYLANTLEQLQGSVFKDCKITVIDNASSDATCEICQRMCNTFKNFHLITNRINIGGNANYLRAVETSDSLYTWVLCDDDYLDFSQCSDVVSVIETATYDLIEVGATERGNWPRGMGTTVVAFLEQQRDYYFRMSFFPAFIFKTALFDSACICWGYNNINNLYPQFAFLNKSVRDNFSIYLATKRIVKRNDTNDNSFFPLVWYAAWLECCKTITNKNIRNQAVMDATAERGFFKSLCFWTIFDNKMNKDGDFWIRVVSILRVMDWWLRCCYLLLIPFALLPVSFTFWVWVRSTLYRFMNIPQEKIPPLIVVDRP